MYKQNKQTRLEQSKRPLLYWIKRKFIIIITAFMLGMANGMHNEDTRIKGNQNYTEQHKKDLFFVV
ncbi:hypothetical protein [Flavobacterium panacagri]|uniref:hypothetical protein n=1 Tax=Flavobacterium panacagri TaxID=3034146 RepID=UPI0025A61CCF|nr:hypothetical protein [Flavobacterium panacagri]